MAGPAIGDAVFVVTHRAPALTVRYDRERVLRGASLIAGW